MMMSRSVRTYRLCTGTGVNPMTFQCVFFYYNFFASTRRGCRGRIPSNILIEGDVNGNGNIPTNYVRSDIADQY